MILSEILHHKKSAVDERKRLKPLNAFTKTTLTAKRGFKDHLKKENHICLIAEVKRASPSAGEIVSHFDPKTIAEIYSTAGANAISVLTEEKFFLGKLGYLKAVRDVVELPVLQKDFIIDPYQIHEAAAYGADAVLLIADILSEEEIKKFIALCKELSLDALVEAHTQEDVEKALAAGAQLIGINNRDLHTFKVDIATTERLIRFIPKEKVIVSESGIKTHNDVSYLRSLGVHAVLIGEAFLRSPDMGAKVREIMQW
ncbi:MAG: indole-3-glycerol phosphate synthase TrpC [Candidatus Omnitrophota bacterium]